jgi:type I restriction enzyme S subunit
MRAINLPPGVDVSLPTIKTIQAPVLRTIPIPLPPLSEEREIAAQLAAVEVKLAAKESRRAALAALFQSLLHHLMTGQVRLPEFVTGARPL